MLAAGCPLPRDGRVLGQLPTWPLPLRVPIVWLSGAIEIGFAVSLVVLVEPTSAYRLLVSGKACCARRLRRALRSPAASGPSGRLVSTE